MLPGKATTVGSSSCTPRPRCASFKYQGERLKWKGRRLNGHHGVDHATSVQIEWCDRVVIRLNRNKNRSHVRLTYATLTDRDSH